MSVNSLRVIHLMFASPNPAISEFTNVIFPRKSQRQLAITHQESSIMKKTFIALAALATCASASYAQSSVTIYGRVDLGLVYDSGNANGKSVRISSGVAGGSRLGFKGNEDLGDGYKAGFVLETGYCADSAQTAATNPYCTGSNLFGRQAFGSLTTPFGAASAGRQYALTYANVSTIDPFNAGSAPDAVNLIDNSGVRLNNSFHYTTPAFFSGLTATGEFALGETTGNLKAGRETGGSVNYSKGPLLLAAGILSVDNANGVGIAKKNVNAGGTYDFGVVKLHALVQRETGDPTTGSAVNFLDILGGATIPLGSGQVMLSYISKDDRSRLNRDASQVGIGYQYFLSKRTAIYTSFARINNRHGATYVVSNATDTGTGNKSFDLGVGTNF